MVRFRAVIRIQRQFRKILRRIRANAQAAAVQEREEREAEEERRRRARKRVRRSNSVFTGNKARPKRRGSVFLRARTGTGGGGGSVSPESRRMSLAGGIATPGAKRAGYGRAQSEKVISSVGAYAANRRASMVPQFRGGGTESGSLSGRRRSSRSSVVSDSTAATEAGGSPPTVTPPKAKAAGTKKGSPRTPPGLALAVGGNNRPSPSPRRSGSAFRRPRLPSVTSSGYSSSGSDTSVSGGGGMPRSARSGSEAAVTAGLASIPSNARRGTFLRFCCQDVV